MYFNNMKLHLIRHAKTSQDSPTGNDFDRELLPKGVNQSLDLKNFLADKKWNSPQVWVSMAKRTQQTWTLIEEVFNPCKLEHRQDFYLCSKQTFLQAIWTFQGSEDLIIVAHNNGISQLASYFLSDSIEMKTGEYLCLKFDADSWLESSQGMASLHDRFRSQTSG